MRRFVFALLLLNLPSFLWAQPKTVDRFVELRDGSLLKLKLTDEPWTVTFINEDGELATKTMPLSQIERVHFSVERTFDKKRSLLELVQLLGSEEYATRELALKKLIEMGNAIRGDLESFRHLYADFEIKARIRHILEVLANV